MHLWRISGPLLPSDFADELLVMLNFGRWWLCLTWQGSACPPQLFVDHPYAPNLLLRLAFSAVVCVCVSFLGARLLLAVMWGSKAARAFAYNVAAKDACTQPSTEAHPFAKYKILCIGNDPCTECKLRSLFANKLYELEFAKTCADGLQVIGGAKVLPSLVLLDVEEDVDAGLQICKVMRSADNLNKLPIMLMIAAASLHAKGPGSGPPMLSLGLDAGADDFITKPLRGPELVTRVEALLKRRSGSELNDADSGLHLSLLTRMLPARIISKLRSGCTLIAERHEQVTVLFSDIMSFTQLSAAMPTEQVVLLLNDMFTRFDDLCDKHGVYKVETVGDAYMVVAGHDGCADHVQRCLAMAADMLAAVADMAYAGPAVKVRIGVHTGPALSGVVGQKNPRYCFYGDTINTASRMESHGFSMTVHVSADVELAVRGQRQFQFADCGPRPIKGKGKMQTYLLMVGDWRPALLQCHGNAEAGQADPGRSSLRLAMPPVRQQNCPDLSSLADQDAALGALGCPPRQPVAPAAGTSLPIPLLCLRGAKVPGCQDVHNVLYGFVPASEADPTTPPCQDPAPCPSATSFGAWSWSSNSLADSDSPSFLGEQILMPTSREGSRGYIPCPQGGDARPVQGPSNMQLANACSPPLMLGSWPRPVPVVDQDTLSVLTAAGMPLHCVQHLQLAGSPPSRHLV